MEMVYIVEPPQASSKARDIGQAVLQNLSRSARPSRVVSWPPDLSELKGRPVVSLMEFDTLILDHISAHDFGLMEKLVQESSSFLWVARGNEATTTAGMGFLEALGKAFQDLKWRFLLLEDKAARDVNELAAIITNIGVHSTPDKCFLEIDGQLCVSRWSQDRGFSRTIGNQGATATDVVPLGEPPASLKLVVNGLGDHQSVYFAADSEMEDGLAGFGEVEIVTKAVSLR
jgi:zearalenone synthase (highly reducing iterative type I polyketide synthase)